MSTDAKPMHVVLESKQLVKLSVNFVVAIFEFLHITFALNPLTAMKKIVPTPGVFWSKSNFFKIYYICQRQNIYVPGTNIV